MNPDPLTDNAIKDICFYSNSDLTLRYRMLRHGLISLDVGGGGDCFFKSVSHQLYGNPNKHGEIRVLGVRYLSDNPEQFIESIVGTSWSQYLTEMSLQGTWANHIVILAVAEAMNLKIHIIESDSNFREVTLVEPANAANITSIYIGHVSTCSHQESSNNTKETVANNPDNDLSDRKSETISNSRKKNSKSSNRSEIKKK